MGGAEVATSSRRRHEGSGQRWPHKCLFTAEGQRARLLSAPKTCGAWFLRRRRGGLNFLCAPDLGYIWRPQVVAPGRRPDTESGLAETEPQGGPA